VKWYRVHNFFLGGIDADIIDLDYKKGMRCYCLITKTFLAIILNCHSWCDLPLSLQKLGLGLVLDKDCYLDGMNANWPGALTLKMQ